MRRIPAIPAADSGQFALRFRLLMSYHDLTLKDIAEGTRCAVSTVGTWKNGRVPSARRVLEKLAEIFHVSVEYLLEGRPAARKGRPGEAPGAETMAERILEDLELLVRALDGGRAAPEEDGRVGEDAPPPARGTTGRKGKTRRAAEDGLREDVEHYMRTYLDRAEQEPGGLAHAWVQLRREFPLDLYERLV